MKNKELTVGIDISPMETHLKRKRGIGQCNFRLARQLTDTKPPFKTIFYISGREPLVQALPGADIRRVPDCRLLPDILKKDGVDLIHLNCYFYPLYSPADFTGGKFSFLKSVITVYDLIPFHFPDRHPALIKKISRNLFAVLNHVDIIRASSLDTKNKLIDLSGIDKEKVKVIHHGLDHSVFHPGYPVNEINRIKKTYRLTNDFILQVSAIDWRKNIPTTIKAFRKILNYRRLPVDLVFAGGNPGRELINLVNSNNLTKQVKFLGVVPESHLPLLYNAASVFALPSYYEGFGLPPLEAMACGLPVVSSDRGSLPEVLGKSAMYINPDRAEDLAGAIYTVLTDAALRKNLISLGLRQAQKYSKKNVVAELTKLYMKMLNEQE